MHSLTAYTDTDLLNRLRDGDRTAFDLLYEKHWDKVYNQAFKKLHNPDVAKDITQEVFIHIWTHRDSNYIDNLEAWLFTSVRNNVFRELKKEQKFIPIAELLVELRAYYNEADADALQKELMTAYNKLVDALPPAQQNIYKMRFHDDLSTEEIAEQLNISRKTVQNQLTRAVSLLKTSLLAVAIAFIAQS